jgi:anti-sigma factor RsiW
VPERSLALIGAGRPSAWLPGWRKLAAGIVLLLFGGLCGWWGAGLGTEAPTAGNQFVQRALNAQVVYAHGESRPVEFGGGEEIRLLNWLSGRLGHKLIGGRLVADKGDAAALFMFEVAKAGRVSLYVRPGMRGGNTKFRFIAEYGMVAFYRTNGPLTYALSGEMPRDDLLHLAQMVHDDLVSRSS